MGRRTALLIPPIPPTVRRLHRLPAVMPQSMRRARKDLMHPVTSRRRVLALGSFSSAMRSRWVDPSRSNAGSPIASASDGYLREVPDASKVFGLSAVFQFASSGHHGVDCLSEATTIVETPARSGLCNSGAILPRLKQNFSESRSPGRSIRMT